MDYFNYLRGRLQAEDLPAEALAEEHGTPLYVYSARTIVEHYDKLRAAFTRAAP
jgi:diaminopimelate decarboxylase